MLKQQVNPDPTVYPKTIEEALRTGAKYYYDPSRKCPHGHAGLRMVMIKPRQLGPNSRWRAFGFTDRSVSSACHQCFKDRARVNSEKRWRSGALMKNRERGLRTHLWNTQSGLCAVCYSMLPYNFHCDHIIGLAEGGDPTDPANLRGLCAPCNMSRKRREQFAEPLTLKEQAQQQLEALDRQRAVLLEVIQRDEK